MKKWKKIVTTALACATFILPVSGESVQTIAGTMPLPTGLNAVSVSNTETVKVAKDIIDYELKKVRNEQSILKSSKSVRELTESRKGLDYLGTVVDVYELYGTSQYGEHSGWMAAVDLRTVGKLVGADKRNLLPINWDGDVVLGPATEQYMIKQVNEFLPKLESEYNKRGQSYVSMTEKNKHPYYRESRLTVENIEYMKKLNNTEYPTYTAGMRAMVTQNGVQFPMYVKAALVMNPKTPTLYLFGADDIEHQYFGPKVDSMISQLK